MIRKILSDSRFWLILKISLGILFLVYFIGKWDEFDLDLLKSQWNEQEHSNLWTIGISFFLLFAVNWLSDTYLWWMVVRTQLKITFKSAFEINLISHAVGIMTPANVGEYGIKALHFTELGRKRQSALLTLSYRAAKWFVKSAAGLSAGIWIWSSSDSKLVWICALAIGVLILIYAFIPNLLNWVYHSRIGRWALEEKEDRDWHFKAYNFWKSLLPAAIKFSSYTGQLALLIALGSSMGMEEAFWRSSAIYSLASFIPSLSLFDPMVKTGIGEIVMSPEGVSLAWLAICTTLVWITNMGIPSIVGYILWLRRKD
ncbi:MAG: flippase-like domain-containing protein [Flavobacteriia bacterium]|nr:flippase-like domain-containing protein [Flavobacteriia bacterium]